MAEQLKVNLTGEAAEGSCAQGKRQKQEYLWEQWLSDVNSQNEQRHAKKILVFHRITGIGRDLRDHQVQSLS